MSIRLMMTVPPISVAITATPVSTLPRVEPTSVTWAIWAWGLVTRKSSTAGGMMPWRSRSRAAMAWMAFADSAGSLSWAMAEVR